MEVIREALERSGYLMESRLVRTLTDSGYFVEPNVAHKDPRTGKSRELDLTAEKEPNLALYPRQVCVKTTFVVEALNNRFPLVALTERTYTPHADTDAYVKRGEHHIEYKWLRDMAAYWRRIEDESDLYAQFCVMTKKSGKDELMASHPDDVYGSLLKMAEHVEQLRTEFNAWGLEGSFRRLFFWHPILAVSGRLLTAKVAADGSVSIVDVPIARLEFNWHDGEEPKTTVVELVREDFLVERMNQLVELDLLVEAELHHVLSASEGRDQ
jgi:hypothetical protein